MEEGAPVGNGTSESARDSALLCPVRVARVSSSLHYLLETPTIYEAYMVMD